MSLSLKQRVLRHSMLETKYNYFSLALAEKSSVRGTKLPKSLKVLLENLLRHIDGTLSCRQIYKAIIDWQKRACR